MGIAASDVNNTTSGNGRGDEILFAWLNTAIAAGWTFTDSNDGAGNAVTGPGVGAGGLGNANAWILATKPLTGIAPYDNPTQIGFQNQGDDKRWKMKIFPIGDATGGTNTTLPTGTDTFFCQNNTNTDTFSELFATNLIRYHIIFVDSAEGHGFNIMCANNGAATFSTNGMVGMDPVEQPHPDDTHPWVFFGNNVSPILNALDLDAPGHGIGFAHQPQTSVVNFSFTSAKDLANVRHFPNGVTQSTPSGDDPALQQMYTKRNGDYKGMSTFFYAQGPSRGMGFEYTDGAQVKAFIAFGVYAQRWNEVDSMIF